MKILLCNRCDLKNHISSILLKMKLVIALLIAAFLQVNAEGYSQQITLSEKNAQLEDVFKQIMTQTDYHFLYYTQALRDAKPVDVELTNASLSEALEQCFKDQPLSYVIDNNTVIVKMLKPSPYILNGKVTNKKGEPLPGVSVFFKGPTNVTYNYVTIGTSTNANGEYELSITSDDKILVFSCIGMKSQEVELAGLTQLNIVMEDEITTLSEVRVVSTGYQTISKERATGAFSPLSKTQIEKPVTSIASRLVGTIAGVQLKFDDSNRPKIELRGPTTLFANEYSVYGGNQPLVVVDGFPVSGIAGDLFATINPNDIESVTVLQDAAAASIWGAKAANGVIVITTKKAVKGMPLKVEFSAFTQLSRKFDVGYATGLASSKETVDYDVLASQKWGSWPKSDGSWDLWGGLDEGTVALNESNLGYMTATQRDARLAKLRTLDNRSQISDYLLSQPISTQYNLALSGSGPNINYRVSMLVENDQQVFQGNKDKRYGLNYNSTANIFKWLDFDLGTNLRYEKQTNNSEGLFALQKMAPYDMLKNPDGSLTDIHQYYQPNMDRWVPLSKFPYSFSYNPIQEMENTDNTQTFINARIQAGLTFKIFKGFSFNPQVMYERSITDNRNYRNENTFYVRDRINTTSAWDQTLVGTVTQNLPLGGFLDLSRSTVEAYTFRNQLNFSRTFSNVHEINVIAGTEISNTVGNATYNPTSYGYNDETLQVGDFLHGATGTNNWQGWGNYFGYANSFSYSTRRLFSAYGNASYTYMNKYTLSGSFRTDASNMIAKAPKFLYSPFYSMGLGWQIAREDFMKNISWIDRLNLRITYGRTGNSDNGSSHLPLLNIRSTPDPYSKDPVASLITLGNPSLTWEKTQSLNLGLDYSILGNKLFGKIEVYNKLGKMLLADVSIPSVNGVSSAKFNNAEMRNKGIEVTIGAALPLKGNDISWTGNLNLSYNIAKITHLSLTNYAASTLANGGSSAYREGYDPNVIWAYQYAGLVNNVPNIVGPNGTPIALSGWPYDDGRQYMKRMGTTNAPYLLGMTNSFKIYDFNLSFIVTAKWGHKFKGQYFNYPTSGSLPNRKVSDVLNGDPNMILPMPSDPNFGLYNYNGFNPYLDYNYLNAGVIRMQEVSVSYNLPKKWLSKINMHGIQLIAQGNNLFSILANKTGEDPEYKIGTIKPRAQYTFSLKFEL